MSEAVDLLCCFLGRQRDGQNGYGLSVKVPEGQDDSLYS